MSDILFVVISCSVEETRDIAFSKVADNIVQSSLWSSIKESTILFDNGSTEPLTISKLDSFQRIAKCEKNVGYWSAVNWLIKNYQSLVPEKKYIYIIESDCIHWEMEKILKCRDFLERNRDVGMVRTQEFSISETHRFDKMQNHADSTKWTRFRMSNFFTGEKVTFWDPDDGIYKTNFVPVLCGLNRVASLQKVFSNLEKLRKITEVDFQREMFAIHKINGQLDFGIFNTSAGEGAIAGCKIESIPEGVPYKPSGHDTITKDFQVHLIGARDEF